MDRLDVKRVQVLEALGALQQPERQGGLTVSQVMTLVPSCVPPETSALELIRLFHTKRFRHLLVTQEGNRLVGVISDRDVIRCLGPGECPDRDALARISAAEIMSTDLVTAPPDMSLERAVVLMMDQGISCLPVLADETLLGVLTNTDLHVVLQVLLQTVRRLSLEESLAAAVSNP